jgi:uncharacterized membrane protein YqaE (UPF0057 family)
MSVTTIILTILLPPLAVALKHGIGSTFVINVILTLLGYIPGLIHGFWVNSKGSQNI